MFPPRSCEHRVALFDGERRLRDEAFKPGSDGLHPALDPLIGLVDEDDREASMGRYLSDPGAHRARANDSYFGVPRFNHRWHPSAGPVEGGEVRRRDSRT